MSIMPIMNPKKFGCGTCGSTPTTILTNEQTFYPYGYIHCLELTIDNILYDLNETFGTLDDEECETSITINDIFERFKDQLAGCKRAILFHNTPLHDETWEYNTEDGKWYLTGQGRGYA